MQISISTRHGHLSTGTQDSIRTKVEKLLRFNDRLSATEVTVDLARTDVPQVEFRVSVEKAEDFVATDEHESLMAAVDSCLHKIEQQLRKHKEKTVGHRGVTGRRAFAEQMPEDLSAPDQQASVAE